MFHSKGRQQEEEEGEEHSTRQRGNNHHHYNRKSSGTTNQKHESRAGLGSNNFNYNSLNNNFKRRNHHKNTLFGTPIFEGDEENERELRAHNQERYTSEHQQFATDENGRRRFHGAFTGGFSAGYFNTVGSKEGWNPSNDFRSERRITDFMDEEDMKEIFGVSGSKQVQATDKFMKVTSREIVADPISDLFGGQINSSDQRHLEALFGSSEKLISLNDRNINYSNETNIGYSLLRKMGWIPSKGIGIKSYNKSDSVELHNDSKVSTVRIKEDKYGIGYKHSTLNDILNIQKPAPINKNNIEEDYYQQDDMSNYDIDLKTTQEGEENTWDEKLIFIKSKQPFSNQTKYLAPKVPEDFVPNHVFNMELIKKEHKKLDHKIQLHLMAADERRKRLFESTILNQKKSVDSFNTRQTEKSKEIQQQLSKAMSNRFVAPSSEISITPKSNSTKTSRERSRIISDWKPDPLLSKRFGCSPISAPNTTTTETNMTQTKILANAFISEQQSVGTSSEPTIVKNQEKIEEGPRPSMDLFKQVFESKVNVIDQDDEIMPSNRIHTPQFDNSNQKSESVLSFDSVNTLKDIVKELKESKGEGSSSLIEKRKAVLESMKTQVPKERREKKEETTEKPVEKKKLDFNVYPIKRDSTSSYISQLESRISEIRKLLDSSDDEEKKKRKKHKKEKKEKKKRKKEE